MFYGTPHVTVKKCRFKQYNSKENSGSFVEIISFLANLSTVTGEKKHGTPKRLLISDKSTARNLLGYYHGLREI